ncbi:HTH-type transcriptional regulator AceR [Acinetobacter rathckeae]|uniref:HTH-type transcriptional regulator AceR n=1 Tax=Acinetobacter rathckeae TaxID=2605272 RepID=UPI0018A25B6F|nr:LysR family transcriptional regulator [Acinetobacter rathckeae]MBF7687151.1 LysR family transcriptional regulator [Acinetobacter rathckeae]MBF7694496.1 LysR family transcriptional regulator [Acinetobacter rathckeae]
MNINQEQLLIFKAVMQSGSFSAAARQLGKVPSAVSMSIANLEIDLNMQLFTRQGREPIATPAAHSLYQKTLYLLSEMNQWKQHAHALSEGLESHFNIVIASELIYTPWIEYILLLEQTFPSLEINVFTAPQEEAMQMLLQGQVQFSLLFEREVLDYRENFVELFHESIVPVVSRNHPLSSLKSVSLEDLDQYRQIVVTSRQLKIQPELLFSKTYWRTNQHHLAVSMIQEGLGWGFLPLRSLQHIDQRKDKIQTLNVINFTEKLNYFVDLVWHKEHAHGVASQFLINYVKKQRADQNSH